MLWRGCVICIVGDFSEDAFVSHWWTENNISKLLKDRKIKLATKVDKSVTHLVCSRYAYQSMVPEVVFIRKVQDRRTHRKPQIVTYDWLEDSIDARKPIADTDAYDPGKPRDIDGMVAAWKETVASVKNRAHSFSERRRTKLTHDDGKEISPGDLDTDDTAHRVGDERSSAISSSCEAHAGPKNQATTTTTTTTTTTSSSGSIKTPGFAPKTASQPKRDLPLPKPVVEVYKDETDEFPYHIELTLVRPDPNALSDRCVAEVNVVTNRVPKLYHFRNILYKNGKPLRDHHGASFRDVEAALTEFATHFRKRTGYAWDHRLLKAGTRGGNGGKWHYDVPAQGKQPTGATRPEYTPGHPRCVRLQGPRLLQNAVRQPGGGGGLRGAGKALLNCRPGHNKATTTTTSPIMKRMRSSSEQALPRKTYKKTLIALPSQSGQKRKLEQEHPPGGDRAQKVQRTTITHAEDGTCTQPILL